MSREASKSSPKEPETTALVLRRKFTICWFTGMMQFLVGWAMIGGGISQWNQTGRFLSFRMLYGIILFVLFACTVLVARPIYQKLVDLKENETADCGS